jgi:beta-ribofuranosylaminobenzene 5'-phosphate synthase
VREPASGTIVHVEARARLHFGVLDLRGDLGRWFGGLGAAAPEPILRVRARPASQLEVGGADAVRTREFARRALEHYGIRSGVDLFVERALPPHVGLGSGTQLAVAVAASIADLFDIQTDAALLANASGRGRRSAIGAHAFMGGGLLVEGGRRPGSDRIAPLIARHPFARAWWCVIAVPAAARGLSGEAEQAAFERLRPPSDADVGRVAHLVLMGLLPGVVDADLEMFGQALTEIQFITGRWFASVQGGTFASAETARLVDAMSRWGAPGVGQSSWGPAVWGILPDEDAGRRCAACVREWLGGKGHVYAGPFPREGARIVRESAPVRTAPGVEGPVRDL